MCGLMVKRQTTSFHLVETKHAAPLCKQTDFLNRVDCGGIIPVQTLSPTAHLCSPFPNFIFLLPLTTHLSFSPPILLLSSLSFTCFCTLQNALWIPCFPPVLSLNNNQKKKEEERKNHLSSLCSVGKTFGILRIREWTSQNNTQPTGTERILLQS